MIFIAQSFFRKANVADPRDYLLRTAIKKARRQACLVPRMCLFPPVYQNFGNLHLSPSKTQPVKSVAESTLLRVVPAGGCVKVNKTWLMCVIFEMVLLTLTWS